MRRPSPCGESGSSRSAHLQVVHPDDVARFRTAGAVANLQPLWAVREPQMDELTIPFLGAERAAWQYPFGDLLRAGATLAADSAHVNHLDDTGTVEPGKLADLVVLDRDPFAGPADAIGGTRVLRTYVGGDRVYAAQDA